MPLFQETTFHDRQCKIDENSTNTSSTIFADVLGSTLTTKDLGSDGSYTASLSILMFSSLNNTTISFRLLANGSPIGSVRNLSIRFKDLDIGYTLLACVEVGPGVVLQLQWKTDIGTITSSERGMIIDGIPLHRVVI